MKKKLVFLFLLVTLMSALLGTTFSANANSSNIINDELIFYMNDINSKIDEIYNMAGIFFLELNSYEYLKDLETNNETFILLRFKPSGYAIYHRETGSIMERNPISSDPYGNVNAYQDLYYNGINTYFYKYDNKIYNVKDKALLNNATQNYYADKIKTYRENDIMFTAADKKQLKTQKAQGSGTLKTIYEGDVKSLYFALLSKRYNAVIKGDRLFAHNEMGTCGQVAAGMLLQFYQRNSIYDLQTNIFKGDNHFLNYAYINEEMYQGKPYQELYDNGEYNLQTEAENLHQFLRLSSDPLVGTAMTSKRISECLNGYFEIMRLQHTLPNVTSTYQSSINIGTFAKNAINSNHPVILVTTTNTAEYQDANGNWVTKDVSWHAFIAYGYTTTQLFSPNEYLCHLGWNDNNNTGYSMAYVNRAVLEGAVRLQFN